MGASGGLITAANAAQGINSAGSAYNNAQAVKAQGEYQKMIYDINASEAEKQAVQAIEAGDLAVAKEHQKNRAIISSQRAAAAASGTDVNSEAALDARREAETIGAANEMTISTNAWREAMGYKSQAINLKSQGKFTSLAAQNTARNTMVSGGIEAATYGLKAYDNYSKNKAPTKKG